VDPERLGRERHLPELLHGTRLRRERCRHLQQLGSISGSDRELEAREQGASNQDEHMFARTADGW
jgi:hypothetical protein